MTLSLAWFVVGCRSDPAASDALSVLIDRVLEPSGVDPTTAVVHEVGAFAAGARIDEAFGDPVDVPEDGTLFLVDATPMARWSHAVDWVWVEDDGGLRTETRSFYPVVDGVGFFPPLHPSVWGAPWVVEDPSRPRDDLPRWHDPADLRRSAPAADPCRPPPVRKALTVAGMLRNAVRTDELNWWLALSGRGYAATSLAPTPSDPVTAADVEAALSAFQTEEHLDELVFTYAGHGDPGELLLGDEADLGVLTADTLVNALVTVRTDHLVLVLDACHSGSLALDLPGRLKAAGMIDTEITVLAAVPSGTLAYDVGELGGMFSRALERRVSESPVDAPIPWSALDLGTYHEAPPPLATTTTSTPPPLPSTTGTTTVSTAPPSSSPPQKQVTGHQVRCRPALLLSQHPDGACLAGWIDAQAYDRRTYIDGIGLGEDAGLLELQAEDGTWVPVPTVYWEDDVLRTALPMRNLGFPANGRSPGAEPGLGAGTYLARATPIGGITSEPQPVRVVYQVYEQVWTPVVAPGDFPDWVELWHPYTDGGTIQLSTTWDASREPSPLPADLSALDADVSEPHHTTGAVLSVGRWFYELEPGERDLATAYDDAEPQTLYWGFRAAFPDDAVDPDAWGFTLVYD